MQVPQIASKRTSNCAENYESTRGGYLERDKELTSCSQTVSECLCKVLKLGVLKDCAMLEGLSRFVRD